MLDLMVATHMATYFFWQIERKPSKLAAIATGLLELSPGSGSQNNQRQNKPKRGAGFKLNFAKKFNSKLGSHEGSSQSGGVLPVAPSSPRRVPSVTVAPPKSDSSSGMFSPKEEKRNTLVRRSFGGSTDEAQAQLQKLSLVENRKQSNRHSSQTPEMQGKGRLQSSAEIQSLPKGPRDHINDTLSPTQSQASRSNSSLASTQTTIRHAPRPESTPPAAKHTSLSGLYSQAAHMIKPVLSSSHHHNQQPSNLTKPKAENYQVYPELVPHEQRAVRPQSMYSNSNSAYNPYAGNLKR